VEKKMAAVDRGEKEMQRSEEHLAAEARRFAGEQAQLDRMRVDAAKRAKELKSQVASLAKREEDAADNKSKAMSLLKYAEKTAEAKGRELNDRMAEQQALMESQQKEMQKVAKAREELEAREHRFETAKAELEARAKALEQ